MILTQKKITLLKSLGLGCKFFNQARLRNLTDSLPTRGLLSASRSQLLCSVFDSANGSLVQLTNHLVGPVLRTTKQFKHSKSESSLPQLQEDDLEESHVRGSGPGGQSVNKTANNVILKHKPTGIVVKCHDTRSLETNQKLARVRLQEKLDWHYNGENSIAEQEKRENAQKRREKEKRTNTRLEKLRAFKEREGLD